MSRVIVGIRQSLQRLGRILLRIPLHPFLFCAYPVVALLANNVDQVMSTEAVRALIVSLVGTAIFIIALRLLLRDWHKAALICTLSLILFFSYGHSYDYLSKVILFGLKIGRHRVMIMIWTGILSIGSWWVLRRVRDSLPWMAALNITAAVALASPLFQVVSYQIRPQADLLEESYNLSVTEGQRTPDIYYIILDAYSRADVLQEFYNFDNSAFLDTLNEMGFYVAGRSQSNYALSALSLSSSLNLEYLEELADGGIQGRNGQLSLSFEQLIRHSRVRSALESLGYKSVTFGTGFRFTDISDADIYYSNKIRGINAFEGMLIHNSALRILTDAAEILPEFLVPDVKAPFEGQRERILYVLDKLENLPEVIGPKFIFAHIVSPHPPYVFGPEGEPVDTEGTFTLAIDQEANREYHFQGYRDQITYLNSRFERLLEQIINKSEIPPVIIIQADHGGPLTSNADRMAILNAYYFPDGKDELLYDAITPVNTFRVIFNLYFCGEYELLEDISYYSTYDDVYNFTIIENK